MESSQPPLATGTGEDFIRRVWALFEVLLVALAGPVFVQIGFIYLNVGHLGIADGPGLYDSRSPCVESGCDGRTPLRIIQTR